jgi:purine-binding chemotaxis protein CheW
MNKTNSISSTSANQHDILKARAELLAGKKAAVADESAFVKVVAFRLAGEIYGIELERIRIVFPVKEVTHIPGAPDFIAGIINMRGEIISIVDLKKLFDLPQTSHAAHRQVIILSSPGMELGIGADQVLGVMQVRENEIQQGLPTLSGIRAQYLKGVTGDGMVILDGEKILTDKNMMIHIEDEK